MKRSTGWRTKVARTPARALIQASASIFPKLESRTIAIVLCVSILIYLVLGPLLMLVLSSFRDTVGQLPFEAAVPWSIENYLQLASSPRTLSVLANTMIFVTGSLALCFGISIAFGWLIERTDLPFRNALYVVIIASFGIPTVISSIAFTLLLNPSSGLINVAVRTLVGGSGPGPLNVYTLAGMTFVNGLTMVPITFLLVTAAFRTLDSTLEDAGSTSGASFRTVLRRISLPLLVPALLGALVFQFVTAIETFDVPFVLGLRGGGAVLSTQVFLETRPASGLADYGLASTYGILLLLIALGPLLLYNRTIGRSDRYATVSGNAYRPRIRSLGLWKIPLTSLAFVYVAVAFIMPMSMIVWTSLQPFYSNPSPESISRISLNAYAQMLDDRRFWDAAFNTLIVGTAAALGAMVIGLTVSWLLVRTRSRLRVGLDVLAFAPHAIPAVIIGLSVFLIYLMLDAPVSGTIWTIVIAMGTVYIGISTRLMTAGIAQIQRQLEEAAAASGASWWATMRRIVLPLVLPAFANGFLLLFLMGIKNLTLPLLLSTPNSLVLSSVLWDVWFQGDTAEAAAIGVLMVGMTLILATLTRRLVPSSAAL